MNEFWAEVLIELLPTDKPILPGQKKYATVKSLYQQATSYSELVENARFEILEGPHVVGFGSVVRR